MIFTLVLTTLTSKNNYHERFNLANSSYSNYWMAIWIFLFFIRVIYPYPFNFGYNRRTMAVSYWPKCLDKITI